MCLIIETVSEKIQLDWIDQLESDFVAAAPVLLQFEILSRKVGCKTSYSLLSNSDICFCLSVSLLLSTFLSVALLLSFFLFVSLSLSHLSSLFPRVVFPPILSPPAPVSFSMSVFLFLAPYLRFYFFLFFHFQFLLFPLSHSYSSYNFLPFCFLN